MVGWVTLLLLLLLLLARRYKICKKYRSNTIQCQIKTKKVKMLGKGTS
jgi:hypothetical protein